MRYTGHTELDRIIAEFLDCEITVDGVGNEAGSGMERAEVRDLRDGELARGQCDAVSGDFLDLLRSRGLGGGLEDVGNHSVTVVETASGGFLVDFTAAQFEAESFPMVARKREAELTDEELEELEDDGYSDNASDPYRSLDFIAVYEPTS